MLADFISYLIFGNHCKYCDELIVFGETLCNECKTDLPRITGEKCKSCGAGKDRCTCKKAKMKYDGICAPFYYEKTAETAIRKFKFADKPYIAKQISQILNSILLILFRSAKIRASRENIIRQGK